MTTLRKSLTYLLILFPSIFVCLNVISNYTFQDADSFWHLACGRQIVSLGYVPTVDSFSFNTSLTDWVNINWLSQIIFYKLYEYLDYFGLSYFSFFSLGILGFLFLTFCKEQAFHPLISSLFFVLTIEISMILNLVRPQTFSIVLFTIISYFYLWNPTATRLSKWQFFFLTVLLILWSQLHGGLILGYFVLSLSALGSYINNWVYKKSSIITTRQIQFCAAMLISVLAFYFHPLGFKALFYVLNYSGNLDELYYEHVIELKPYTLDFKTGHYVTIPVIIALYICIKKKLDLNYEVVLPNISLLLISLHSVRFLPFFFIYFSPTIIKLITSFMYGNNVENKDFFKNANKLNSIVTSGIFCILPIFLNFFPGILGTVKHFDPEIYPTNAINYFSNLQGEKIRVFADYNFAGYVIWKASDKVQVFIDGRGDLHSGIPTYKHYLQILTLDPEWRNILEGYKTDYVFLSRQYSLLDELERDGWNVVYKDKFFEILKNPKSL